MKEESSVSLSVLRGLGYAVLPVPRKVTLSDGNARLSAAWRVGLDGVPADDIAVSTLTERLRSEHGVTLPVEAETGAGRPGIHLSIQPAAVGTGLDAGRDGQAYRLEIAPGSVRIAGNAAPGLFYGVQTLLQLLDGDGHERGRLPVCRIEDWPRFDLRICHWDTKHHQDRFETLLRFLDESARFKINGIGFELEDKFEYPSHPLIGAPGAYTAVELQRLTDEARRRHIELIPVIQAPAHLCYVLKHPEFAHLRCDGSNYQACMADADVERFIFDMFRDVCEATRGGRFFHVSTDEVYYAGICERFRKPYNPENRSLTWVDFVTRAHAFLAAQGRRVIVWAEFPLLPAHIPLLPADVIHGLIGTGAEGLPLINERGMNTFAYTSMQGEETLFPNYFPCRDANGNPSPGRMVRGRTEVLEGKASRTRTIGTFTAAWDDAGLHNETFWLGWAAIAQAGWSAAAAGVEETTAAFMDVFYAPKSRPAAGSPSEGATGQGIATPAAADLVQCYRELQSQARWWERAWERLPSKVRGPGYGYSSAKRPVGRTDMTLLPPGLPRLPDLAFEPVYRVKYRRLLDEIPSRLEENVRLAAALKRGMESVHRNRYNLEVLLSIVEHVGHFIRMLRAVDESEDLLLRASEAGRVGQSQAAAALMTEALGGVRGAVEDLCAVFGRLQAVWEKARHRKGRSAGGREFIHVMDDVKDHFADRRPDLSYMIAPEQSIGLDGWCSELELIIGKYRSRSASSP